MLRAKDKVDSQTPRAKKCTSLRAGAEGHGCVQQLGRDLMREFTYTNSQKELVLIRAHSILKEKLPFFSPDLWINYGSLLAFVQIYYKFHRIGMVKTFLIRKMDYLATDIEYRIRRHEYETKMQSLLDRANQ